MSKHSFSNMNFYGRIHRNREESLQTCQQNDGRDEVQIKIQTVYPRILTYPTYANQLSLTDQYIGTENEESYLNWFLLQFSNLIGLVSKQELSKIESILKDHEFAQGFYDIKDNSICNAVRSDIIGMRLRSHQIYPFIKKV